MREPGRFARGVLVSAAIGVFAIVLVGTLLLALVGFGIGGHVSALIPVLLIGYGLFTVVRRGFEMRRLATEGVETSGTVTRKVTFREGVLIGGIRSRTPITMPLGESTLVARWSHGSSTIAWRWAVP
jgi:hypothetical protein